MQIVLMRHGKPEIDKHLRLNAMEFGAWVEKYNAAAIDAECKPPQAAIEQAKQSTFIVCSNLTRSLESAKTIGIGRLGLSDPMFREMEMPHAEWHFPKLSVLAWSVIFRLAWAFGYSAGVESFKAAKERARNCAEHLASLASVHGTVLFVGHGSLNWFIAKNLKKMGWLCAGKPPRRYWEFSVYHILAA
ncbi:histidine phosphatase family protein [Zoogloea sp.]|uniref:histidine phosphatase family protein n=1 Tax=Zoogloea sp. TaxID=49181 RepID=UPI00141616A1|nr:MAG: histidine phosphatase family protein [Zoogloea sp.]